MAEETLSPAELTYLEMTAKYAPHELPGSSAVVLRLVREVLAREEELREAEALMAQVADLQDQLTQLESDYKAEIRELTQEKTELQHEIEDLRERFDYDGCPCCI